MATKMFDKETVNELGFRNEVDGLESIDVSEWEQEGKYQYRYIVFLEKKTGLYWRYWQRRSGSPFSDWCYEDWNLREIECHTVREKEIRTTIWVPTE